MTLQRFSRDALPATPWKNGGGTTQEIVSWPPGAGLDAFDWRASIATIAASGPFSVFAGVDRTIMLLEGGGVWLHGDGIAHRLDRPHEPYAFRGDVALDCSLLDGASRDLNVMSRRERGQAEVAVLDVACTIDPAPGGLLLSLHGRWRAGDMTLAGGEGLWWADAATAWPLTPLDHGARLVAVRWTLRA